MLPKTNRNTRKDIDYIFKYGKSLSAPYLTLRYLINSRPEKQISFICPKTVSKKAVVRNKLRRRGYGAIKEYENLLPHGFTGAFLFNKRSLDLFGGPKNKKNNPFLNLKNEIKKILDKIY